MILTRAAVRLHIQPTFTACMRAMISDFLILWMIFGRIITGSAELPFVAGFGRSIAEHSRDSCLVLAEFFRRGGAFLGFLHHVAHGVF